MTGLLLELRRGLGKWLILPVIVLGVFASVTAIPPGPAVWPLVVTALSLSVQLTGPLVAGVAAIAGTRARRRNILRMEQLAVRHPAQPAVAELGALLLWVFLAMAITTAIVYIRASLTATWSGPDALRTATTVVGELLAVTVGFLAGRAVPRRITPPVVTFALYAVSANLLLDLRLFSPVNTQEYDQFVRLNHAVPLGQLLWYAGLAASLLCAWAVFRLRSAAWTASLIGSVGAAAVGAAILIPQHGESNEPGVVMAWNCSGSAPQICIHPSLISGRPEVENAVRPVADHLRGTVFALTRVEQRTRGLGSTPTPGAVGFALDNFSRGALAGVTQDLAVHAITAPDACFNRDDAQPAYALQQLVAAWAAGDPNLFVPGSSQQSRDRSWFDSLSVAQRRSWLAQHESQLRSCSLHESAFHQ